MLAVTYQGRVIDQSQSQKCQKCQKQIQTDSKRNTVLERE